MYVKESTSASKELLDALRARRRLVDMSNAPKTWTIAARNPAFGIEGRREYVGGYIGASRAAKKIANAAGYNWTPVVQEVVTGLL